MGKVQPAVHRAIVIVDVENFGDPARTNAHQLAVRDAMYKALRQSFASARISWAECAIEDRGDGVLILVPATVPKSWLITRLPARLADRLARHNAVCPWPERIRLRMALHAGEVHQDSHGFAGTSVNRAFRLIEAPPSRTALRATSAGAVALIVSDWFYDEVVRHDPAAESSCFRQVTVVMKETEMAAWVRVLPDRETLTPVTTGPTVPAVQHSLPPEAAAFGTFLPPAGHAGPLTGRDDELASLATLIEQVARGHGRSVLIEGEPGIGKSALVQAALAGAPEAGCQVFWGAGDELGQALPLLPFLDGLQVREPSVNPRRTTIIRLLRGEVAADRGTDVPAVLAEQLLALVAEQCLVRPTILVVDDLQWADQASITLWGRLARSVRQVPLLLIGMMRPAPQREDLLALRRVAGDAVRLQLPALTETAVADLVARLAGGKPDSDLLRLADGAAGNPLYLTELVAALARSSSLIITEAGGAEIVGQSAPGSLAAAIADRLGFVTRPVREVLRAAALLGVDFGVADLATVLGRSVTDLISAIDEARAVGVLAESGHSLGFRHPLIRAALYEEMPAAVRAAWHRDAGRALAKAGAPPDRVARQVLRAAGAAGDMTQRIDEWMLDWLVRTADLLVAQAPGVATDLLTQAVASCPPGMARHGWLASRLADALYRIGDRTAAEQVAARALEHATEPDLLVDLHWTLAQCRMVAGDSLESLATLDRALATPGLSTRHRARLLVLAARTHSNLGEVATASRVATSALAVASEAGDNWAMGWALLVLALVTSVQGQMADALPLFGRALNVTQADPALTDLRLLLQLNESVTLGNLDRYAEALIAAGQARHLADQLGTTCRLTQVHCVLGQLLFQTGEWDEALAEVEILPEDLKEPAAACCDRGIAAVIGFHRGEIGAARRHLTAAALPAELLGRRLISSLALARSLDREHDGALPEALAALTEAIDGDTEEVEEIEDLLPDAVRLATQAGDLVAAQSLATRAAELAAGSEIPHRQANALYCRGLLDHDALGLLAAAGRYEDAGRPLLRAKALEAAAAYFAGPGGRGQAQDAFTRAREVYVSLGAAADVARMQTASRSGSAGECGRDLSAGTG